MEANTMSPTQTAVRVYIVCNISYQNVPADEIADNNSREQQVKN